MKRSLSRVRPEIGAGPEGEGRARGRGRRWAAAVVALAATLLPPPITAQDQPVPRHHPFRQGVRYDIEAFLDDRSHVLRGRAELRYTNRSPDTLERLYFHQYLNAFRPHSAWALDDLMRGDSTFQALGPRDRAFERLLHFSVDGTPVAPVYLGVPDSTVFYVVLPEPLAPGESLTARIDWAARLSTEPRRQGREGRHYNWAHWYPRVAVYGADGWEYRPHLRRGEFNGEFATYDVRMDLPSDQVVGATGVPVEGDPGWGAVAIPGSRPPRTLHDFYPVGADDPLDLLPPEPVRGRRQIRWHARNVHHFAWSASPDYRYLGGRWRGRPIHLLWQPSNEEWDPHGLLALQKQALDWVVEIFGEYPWPQLTVTERIEDGGATEFPMLYMSGSGRGVVHETVHMIIPAAIATNEWREAWLDEAMANFLSAWFSVRHGADPEQVWAGTESRVEPLDRLGRSEPIGWPGAAFSSYGMYYVMSYYKGSLVLRMLRDELGEETFRRGLRELYQRFRFRQLTADDFQRVMEAVSGRDLNPFFHRWVETAEGRIGG